jgi:hypothetical protein
MTTVTIFTVGLLSYIGRITLVGLLVAFGVWASRRIPLRSLPWLGAYLLLGIPIPIIMSVILGQIMQLSIATVLGLSKSDFIAQCNIWGQFVSVMIHGLVAVLVLSDVLFLMARAGVEIERRPLHTLLALREHSTVLGTVLVCLTLLYPVTTLLVWIATAR